MERDVKCIEDMTDEEQLQELDETPGFEQFSPLIKGDDA